MSVGVHDGAIGQDNLPSSHELGPNGFRVFIGAYLEVLNVVTDQTIDIR